MAYVLFQVRHALEDLEEVGRPPRWIRVARGAPEKAAPLGTIVSLAVDGIAETVSLLAELTLKIEELLYQTDAAKAIGEVVLRMIEAMTDKNFQDGVNNLAGSSALTSVKGAMDTINSAATQAEKYLKYIPEPEDVHGLGHELYRMLCIVQSPMPRTADNLIKTDAPELRGSQHVVQEFTGKVRLMAWSYGHDIKTHGLGADRKGEKPLAKLGSRRLYMTASRTELPGKSTVTWTKDETSVTVFDFSYGGDEDVKELVELLQRHGYNTPPMQAQSSFLTPDIRENLMRFQFINELPITGELDNHTLNRLLHLDFARKNLRRVKPFTDAKPWDVLPSRPLSSMIPLVNAGGDDPGELNIEQKSGSQYRYYRIPAVAANGGGWISDGLRGLGFVAVQSRKRIIDGPNDAGRMDGGKWSEGESAHGSYFFVARPTEPWRAGRFDAAGPGSLDPVPLPEGTISSMYQWIALPQWLRQPPFSGWKLSIHATVLQRSLFMNRASSAGGADTGRIFIELYTGTVSTRGPEGRLNVLAKTEWFPDQGTNAAAMTLPEIDRHRIWILRKSNVVEVPPEAGTLCLVAEGRHQQGMDIDAYFDDFEIHYSWNPPST
jgi:hypothetical protein